MRDALHPVEGEYWDNERGDFTEQLTGRKVKRIKHRAGQRPLRADASSDAHSGAMVALMPTTADAARLALRARGAETADELHCTLWYLGGDTAAWDPDMRAELVAVLTSMARAGLFGGPVQSRIFGIAHWNAGGKAPSWVWSVGDDPDADTVDCPLDNAHRLVCEALENLHGQPDDMPVQHSPWVAHVCAAYTDDLTLAVELEKRNGPVVFDRVRVSFGEDDTDIILEQPVTAAASHYGEFRRGLTAAETASRIDFAGHQRGWLQAVDSAMHDWAQVEATWRNSIRSQLAAGASADQLAALHLDTSDASDLLYRRMYAAAEAAGRAQQRAAEDQGVTVPPWSLGDDAVIAALSGRALLRTVARLTAEVLSGRLVQSARRLIARLLDTYSGVRLASEVESALQKLSDAFTREEIGTAMTGAQAAGRLAVLQASPVATYYSSELLDDRTCQPCRDVDGKPFASLNEAEAAYPGGCYADCQGGGRCRGQIAAVWDMQDPSLTAAAKETGMATATGTDLGGRPNQGTKRDKRLKQNKMTGQAPCGTCPDDAEHFGSSNSTSTVPWDGAASRFDDDQYREAAAACDPGGTPKEACFLPHHEPGGALNVNGLHAAASRFATLKGHSPEAVAKAKAHLRAHYDSLGETVPDSLEAASATLTAAVSCPDGWKPDPGGDGCVPNIWSPGDKAPACPPGMMRDPDSDGCVMKASVQLAAGPAGECPPGMEPDGDGNCVPMGANSGKTAPWTGVLAVEGVPTGDGREFAPDALTWRDLPVPLRWNRVDSHGGEPRTEAVNVGRIDTIERVGNELRGTGMLDLSTPDGQTVHDKIKGKFIRGVSIDADNIANADVEHVWPQGTGEDGEEADLFEMLFAQPEKTIYHGGRISGATLCDIPAFPEAYVALVDDAGAITAGGAMDAAEWRAVQPEPGAVVAHAAVFAPQAAWFANPQLPLPTPVTVDDSGRVYGHAALWGTCHIGQSGVCVQPPREDTHDYYLTGTVGCDDGSLVQGVGQITVGTGHASLRDGARAAAEHYDNTGTAVADVVTGNDAHGIWVAGCIRGDADPGKVAALRASGQVSGDWRPIGGKLRLVALLAVNVPGFPVPRMRARVAGGQLMALVAAGQPTVAPGAARGTVELSEAEQDQVAMRRVMAMLTRRVKEQ